jgi:transposase
MYGGLVEASRDELARFFDVVLPHLNELQRRVVAGAMAEGLGRGGKSAVAEASGMSRNTVIKAEREVIKGLEPTERQRAVGGGDIKAEDKQPGLLEALDELVHPETRGNPMSYMRWTSKSTGNLATELVRQGYKITDDTVGRILRSIGYSLQAPSKQKEGAAHPDRDAQFNYLNKEVSMFMKTGQPVISVDTKKKEIVGEFSNGGAEWHPKGEPTRTKTHDFVDKELGRAVPYGVYDLANDEGWVSVGDTADTASFAVEAIRRWWRTMGQPRFPAATKLLITADAGGSNGYRVKLWKVELAQLAQETGLEITVVHYPPGTSKWNRIEHKMFSFISMNWRGRPLVSYRTIVELISNTTTSKGLKIRAEEDLNYYETGTKVSAAELAAVPLTPHKFHGDWNYTIAQSVNR